MISGMDTSRISEKTTLQHDRDRSAEKLFYFFERTIRAEI
jgi:hypothetical protein